MTAPATDAAVAGTFTDVAGTWVQPKATCAAGERSASAFWVGLGGFDEQSTALEQTGTEADCGARGRASYSAWYELVPAAPVTVPLKVRPGDRITGAVLVQGAKVVVSLKNLTLRKRFSKTFPLVQPLDTGSAEWVAEAPSICSANGRCSVVPLTNFGTVSFSRAATIGNGHPGTIADPTWDETQMSIGGGAGAQGGSVFNPHDAVASALSADGRAFSVTWQAGATTAG